MTPALLVMCVGGAFVVGHRIGSGSVSENARLARENAELRAEVLGHIFRPVPPEEQEAAMAEWLSQYDPTIETE